MKYILEIYPEGENTNDGRCPCLDWDNFCQIIEYACRGDFIDRPKGCPLKEIQHG